MESIKEISAKDYEVLHAVVQAKIKAKQLHTYSINYIRKIINFEGYLFRGKLLALRVCRITISFVKAV